MPAAALEAAPDAAAPPSVIPWSADHPCAAPDLAHARSASSSRHPRRLPAATSTLFDSVSFHSFAWREPSPSSFKNKIPPSFSPPHLFMPSRQDKKMEKKITPFAVDAVG